MTIGGGRPNCNGRVVTVLPCQGLSGLDGVIWGGKLENRKEKEKKNIKVILHFSFTVLVLHFRKMFPNPSKTDPL